MSSLGGGSTTRIAVSLTDLKTPLECLLELQKLFSTKDVISPHGHNFTKFDHNILSIGTKDDQYILLVRDGHITSRKTEKSQGVLSHILGASLEELLRNFINAFNNVHSCVISSTNTWGTRKEGFAFFICKEGENIVRFKVNASYEDNSSHRDY